MSAPMGLGWSIRERLARPGCTAPKAATWQRVPLQEVSPYAGDDVDVPADESIGTVLQVRPVIAMTRPRTTEGAVPRPAPPRRPGAADPMSDDPHDHGRTSDDLDAREAERIRRRDHDLEAERRALMNPGMGKVFKQIQDAQLKAGEASSVTRPKGSRRLKRRLPDR